MVAKELFHSIRGLSSALLRQEDLSVRKEKLSEHRRSEKDAVLREDRHFIFPMDEDTKGRSIVQMRIVLVFEEIQLEEQFIAIAAIPVIHRPELRRASATSGEHLFIRIKRVAIAVVRMEERTEIART